MNTLARGSAYGRQLFVLLLVVFFSSESLRSQSLVVTDIGPETGFQDTLFGHYKKGRANIVADFDLDGYDDFYIGNPGDTTSGDNESFVLHNVEGPGGGRVFVLQQVLLVDELAWGGVAFDYDNDGDYDLFVTCGGNEGIGFDHLLRNDWILDGVPTGTLSFTDVTDEAGVAGPVPAGETTPIPTASANAVIADYDQDGDDDIFVNGNINILSLPEYPELIGRNTLWKNNGDGTFSDVTDVAGLSISLASTRHSTFLDIDNDGDADLFENNFTDPNILWRNNGDGSFTDVTDEWSAPGSDLSEPANAFASGAADFNNDGWEDLIVFNRGGSGDPSGGPMGIDCGDESGLTAHQPGHRIPVSGITGTTGHALYINQGPVSDFEDEVSQTIINNEYVEDGGVMGCMIGDINNDGVPDIYIGNGGPPFGVADQMYISRPDSFPDFVYDDFTPFIDFPAEVPPGFTVPEYPYRTHGTSFVDIDNDGRPEIAVANGGTARSDSREPNRLFRLEFPNAFSWFDVRPKGNGVTVSRNAIGTRISLEVSREGGAPWTVYRTLFAGSCFSAQNGFRLHFGLADADSIERMNITWPDGTTSEIDEGLRLNTSVDVQIDSTGNVIVTGIEPPRGPADLPAEYALEQNFPNPFNPSTTIRYSTPGGNVRIEISDLLGRRVATLVSGHDEPGTRTVTWDGRNSAGRPAASGMYVYRMISGGHVMSRKMLLMK